LATNFTSAFTATNLTTTSIDNILVSIESNGTSGGTFDQSGGSAPSAVGLKAASLLVARGWTITVTGGLYDTDYQNVVNEWVTNGYALPSASTMEAQNQLVIDLKAAGVWSKLDAFNVFATDGDSNSALVDWKRLVTQTAVNAPTFTSLEGFTGDGVSAFIDTLYNPITDGVNYGTDDNHFSVKAKNISSNFESLLGARNVNIDYITGVRTANNSTTFVNYPNSSDCFIHSNRNAPANSTVFKDGVLVATGVDSSIGIPNNNYYGLSYNNGGTAGLFSNSTLQVVSIGGSLNGLENDFYTAINTYMSSI